MSSNHSPVPERSRYNWRFAALAGLLTSLLVGGVWLARTPERDVPRRAPVIPPALKVVPQPADESDSAKVMEHVEIQQDDGCGKPPPFVGRGELGRTTTFGVDRVLAHVPESYNEHARHPLIILLHQWGDDPAGFLDVTRLPRLADEQGFIVIAPGDGPFYPWNEAEDMERVKRQVKLARDLLCVDGSRIYGLGNGDGGMIVEQMPCELEVTAIATTAFRSRRTQIECDWFDTRPIPYLMLSATKDRYNPVEGGRDCSDDVKISLADKEQTWRERHRCSAAYDVRKINTSECRTFRDCEVPLVSCRVDGGHNWPNTPKRVADYKGCDGVAADFPYRDTIWAFFDSHVRDPTW